MNNYGRYGLMGNGGLARLPTRVLGGASIPPALSGRQQGTS